MLFAPTVVYLLLAAPPAVSDGTIELDPAAFDRGARRILPMIGKSEEIDPNDQYRTLPHAISLEGKWRYSALDEAATPSVNLDDSSWPLKDTDLTEWPGDEKFGKAGWFRLHLRGADKLAGYRLGLLISNTAPIEVWLDGQPIFEQKFQLIPLPQPIELHGPEHLLAIRLDGDGIDRLRERGLASGVFVSLVDVQPHLQTTIARRMSQSRFSIFFGGAAITLAMLHLFMFVMLRDRRENLYFALEVLSVGAILTAVSSTMRAESASALELRVLLFQLSVLATSLFGVIAAYSIFLPALPKYTKIMVIVAVLAAIASVIGPGWIAHLAAMVLILEQLRVVATAFIAKKPGSRIIAVGSSIFLITAFAQMLVTIGVVRTFEPLIYMYGFCCLLIAMSFYLAQRFAGVDRLQQMLTELRATQAQLVQSEKMASLGTVVAEQALAELRATQAQLVQSEKMASLGALVAGVAHEINTPIGAINSVHDSLKRAVEKLRAELEATNPAALEGNNKLKGALKVIDDAARVIDSGSSRVTEIVKRLRSFARLDEADMKKVDLHEGIDDTLMLLQHQLKHGVKVVKNYGEVPPLACYPSQLNQVFLNLLVNARQAIAKDGEIEITTGTRNGFAFVEIRDNGQGIPAENMARIFDPGFTTKGVGVGTGLGLSICYQIMKHHKGEIQVKSELGKGTTFTLLIPLNLA